MKKFLALFILGLLLFPIVRFFELPLLLLILGLGAVGGIFLSQVFLPWRGRNKANQGGPPLRYSIWQGLWGLITIAVAVAIFRFTAPADTVSHPLQGHTDQINAMVLSSPPGWLASGGLDRTIRIWNMKEYKNAYDLPDKYTAGFTCVAYSPDGTLLAFASADNTIRIWNVREGALVRQLAGHSGAVRSLTFSPDGLVLASGSEDKTIRLWNVRDGKLFLAKPIEGHVDTVTTLAFFAPQKGTPKSTERLLLASGSLDRMVRLTQITNGKLAGEPLVLKGHTNAILSVAFTVEGDKVYAMSDNRSLIRWNVGDGKVELESKNADTIKSAAFNREGTLLITGDSNNAISLWSTGELKNPIAQFKGHQAAVTALSFNSTGGYFVSGSADNSIRVWKTSDTTFSKARPQHHDQITGIAIDANGVVASSSADKTIGMWQWESDSSTILQGATLGIKYLAFTGDMKNLVSVSSDGYIRLWKLEDRALLREWTWMPSSITSLVVGKNNVIAVGNASGFVRCWNLFDNVPPSPGWQVGSDAVSSVALSSDGKLLATGSGKKIDLWTVDGKKLGELPAQNGKILLLAFSENNSMLASTDLDRNVQIWHFVEGQATASTQPIALTGFPSHVNAIVFTPDGSVLITADRSRGIRLWNTDTGLPMFQMQSFAQSVQTFGFKTDDTIIAAGETSPDIRTWEVANVKDVRGWLSRLTIQNFIFGSELARLYLAIIAAAFLVTASGYGLLWFLSGSAAQVMASEHPEVTIGQARRWAMDVHMGIHKIEQLVSNGEVKTIRPAAGNLARLGGPGVLIVEEGHAVVLLRSGQVTRVVGNGITWLQPFERVHMVVYLPSRSENFKVADLTTLDKMILTRIELTISHRLDRGNQTDFSGSQYPFDPKIILERAWSPKGGDWCDKVKSIGKSVLRDVVAQYNFEDIISISGAARLRLVNDLKEQIDQITRLSGIEITYVGIGLIEISEQAKQALEQKILADLERQAQIIKAEAEKETLARRGEGEAIKLRRVEEERTAVRREFLHHLIDPLRDPRGNPLENTDLLRRYMNLVQKLLDNEVVEKISHAEGNKTFIVGDTKGMSAGDGSKE